MKISINRNKISISGNSSCNYNLKGTIMTISIELQKQQQLIHKLLKRYKITYNYDEYFQILFIHLWQLLVNYNPQHSNLLESYLYIRLRFHLIDQFRSKHLKYHFVDINLCHLEAPNNFSSIEASILYTQFSNQLSHKEQQWFLLSLQGYKQYEIANIMQLSLSTIKNYKKAVQVKYSNYFKI